MLTILTSAINLVAIILYKWLSRNYHNFDCGFAKINEGFIKYKNRNLGI